ncbi:MAG: aspartyl protease family protein [Candidatus Eisenbacteria bacterium]|nr:aspartyl protease family protein [Candidatus Eisenbacteria bacterium]
MRPIAAASALALLLVAAAAAAAPRGARAGPDSAAAIVRSWPAGTEILHFENLEGAILVTASLRGANGRDTTGLFVLDTGAGFLALDHGLARALGLVDGAADSGVVGLAARPVPRFTLGGMQLDQVSPVLTVDAGVIRRVTDRPVLGLIGKSVLADRVLWLDYRAGIGALVPAIGSTRTHAGEADPDSARAGSAGADSAPTDDADAGGVPAEGARAGDIGEGGARAGGARSAGPGPARPGFLSARAVSVPVRLAGDGKVLVRARASDPRPPHFGRALTLILDTGATKSVFFENALATRVPRARSWRSLRGLTAPTLIGTSAAWMVRVPELQVEGSGGPVRVLGMDAAVIRSELETMLSQAVGEPVHGLLGYSFLKGYRVALDYPGHMLWLDPVRGGSDERPYEYSHVGVQLERVAGAACVVAVAEGSPAARAGVASGDLVVAIDGEPAAAFDLVTLARRLEGPPGSRVTLTVRRGSHERICRLARRRLL